MRNWGKARTALLLAGFWIVLATGHPLAADDSRTAIEPAVAVDPVGGSSFLGGYSSARFRDEKLLALAGEYRFEIVPRVELALIFQAGKVFATMSEFDLRHLQRSWGVGIRLKSLREVRLRLDVMRSVEATRVEIKFGPSF